jgi:hypothetical protein
MQSSRAKPTSGDTVIHTNGNTHQITEVTTRSNGLWYRTYTDHVSKWWYGETLTWNRSKHVWESLV